MGTLLRTFANRLWLAALGWFAVGITVLAADYLVRRSGDANAQFDPSQVNAVSGIAWLLFGLSALSILLWVLRQFGLIGALDSAELRHEACVDCHHDYAMPKQKDREDDAQLYPGDVYRVEVRNRIRAPLSKVTLRIDEADPPIEGLQVRTTLMNDPRPGFPESHAGVTIAPGKSLHWTVAVMYDEGPHAKKPFLATVNGPRPLNLSQDYRISLHAESNGQPVAYGDFQVYYTQQTHLRFRKVTT